MFVYDVDVVVVVCCCCEPNENLMLKAMAGARGGARDN